MASDGKDENMKRTNKTKLIGAQVGFNSRYSPHCHSNFRFSVTRIENLNCTIRKDINNLYY